ncbi:hypothetical protein Acr_05g0005860 [Actinidia rufa]|uniref:Uncharacterized protein n=1 Tax=Actinidia rufa TaxID=165716 RepID=A0A7J0EMY6_9ERIC|nr:hypothetical protein Acr_05g0005860 [Actinidia rufa]
MDSPQQLLPHTSTGFSSAVPRVTTGLCSLCLGRDWTLAGLLASVHPLVPAMCKD